MLANMTNKEKNAQTSAYLGFWEEEKNPNVWEYISRPKAISTLARSRN